MRFATILLTATLILACSHRSALPRQADPIVRFWSIVHLSFNDEAVELDQCTREDYLDVRTDHIALSYHCEYSKPDSIPIYHVHKLNWAKNTDGSYHVFSDDKSMNGQMYIDEMRQLHMHMDKKNNRQMKAVFK